VSKGKFERTKPHVNVGRLVTWTMARRTLTAALTKVMAEKFGGEFKAYDQIDKPLRSVLAVLRLRRRTWSTRAKRVIRARGLPGPCGLREEHDHGCGADGRAILWFRRRTVRCRRRESIFLLARQVGVPYIVVFLNKRTWWTMRSYWSWWSWRCGICWGCKFPGDATPIITGSALKALEGDAFGHRVPAVLKLVQALDDYIPVPKRAVEGRF